MWRSGFENGFPGNEWLDFDDGSYSASGAMPQDRVAAWTIVNRQSGEPVFAGNYARGLQNSLRADRKILKIANRRADNIKNSSHLTIITNERLDRALLDSFKLVRVLLE